MDHNPVMFLFPNSTHSRCPKWGTCENCTLNDCHNSDSVWFANLWRVDKNQQNNACILNDSVEEILAFVTKTLKHIAFLQACQP
jgi:hypothetical protein